MMVDKHPDNAGTLRWYAGVPIGTNPIVLFDVIKLSFFLWCLTVFSVGLLQIFIDGMFVREQIKGAIGLANHLVILVWAVFFAVAFLFLQNRYVVLCRLDGEGAYCESMRRGWGSLSESFHWRAFAVKGPVKSSWGPGKSARKTVPWACWNKVCPRKTTRTILLKEGKVTILRLYCPDGRCFEQAVDFLKGKEPAKDDGNDRDR